MTDDQNVTREARLELVMITLSGEVTRVYYDARLFASRIHWIFEAHWACAQHSQIPMIQPIPRLHGRDREGILRSGNPPGSLGTDVLRQPAVPAGYMLCLQYWAISQLSQLQLGLLDGGYCKSLHCHNYAQSLSCKHPHTNITKGQITSHAFKA